MSPVPGKIDVAWTREQEEFIRERWADGDSARQIGLLLGRSRNSICSKLGRLGLLKTRATPAKNRKRAPPRTYIVLPMLPIPKPADKRALRGRAWQPLAGTTPVSLVDLEHGMCKWPLGDSPFLFCGAASGERSYCHVHHDMSVGKGTESERAAHRARERAPA